VFIQLLREECGANGVAFLRGVIVGYEISTRIGAAMGRAHYRYWHNTGTIYGALEPQRTLGVKAADIARALLARLWILERSPTV
jgi:hypothetical protein